LQVTVYNHLDNDRKVYEGSDLDVKSAIFKDHPYLLHHLGWDTSIEDLVRSLDRSQHFSAIISSVSLIKREMVIARNAQIFNKDRYMESIRSACEFLSGFKASDLAVRQALLANDGDEKVAMLDAHNIIPSKANLEALEAVLVASLDKSEILEDAPVAFNEVEAFNEGGKEFAEMVKRASKDAAINAIKLGVGKHSKGTLIAKDPETHLSLILKPGAGKQNPASGEKQNPASQSVREAAFYAIAAAWGLGKFLPECHLLIIDGIEYAAMQFLQSQWVNGNELKAEDPNKANRLLHIYLVDGSLHKLAALDYVNANPDRHSGNVMFCGPEIRLIDHGSALAGIDFKPPTDKYSFVPYYLRVFCRGGFSRVSVDEKVLALPRVNPSVEKELGEWLLKLDGGIVQKLLISYNIDPVPELARLDFLKFACGIQPADLAVNSAWVVP
jgi:hypothetical protein